ncbi:lactonase family protein [Salinicola rhizosphaerae]|uniref:6-phosphogluconolactonase n=1 Tax=Salinicola rhizosphaerae TaxID=1443141 RepID=A0ABQ3E2D4_9GAMM|nr:beta-propeller fold lactonase family protein [Salinicola rhizosphaerae]GHB24085.1 6-phosphogluconolactonase [Salinicola rhizosphaerae]
MSHADTTFDTVVYVTNAGDGTIGSYGLDRQAQRLVPMATTPAAENVMPLALSPDRRFLYAGVRSEPLRALSFRIEPDGTLSELSSGALEGSMAYIETDRSGRYLLAASYGGSVVSTSPIDEHGVVGDALETLPSGKSAHAIAATPDNRYVFATHLGDDTLAQYRFEDGTLTPNDPPLVDVESGSGPRHFVFAPNGRFVFVLGEFSGSVTTFALDAESGTLSHVAVCSALPDSMALAPGMPQENIPAGDDTQRIWAADIHITPDGRHLYVSERTSSTLSTLRVDPDSGQLEFIASQPTVKQPRGFEIDPTGRYLVAVGERSDHLILYAIDPASGTLEHLSEAPVGAKANWVEIVAFD